MESTVTPELIASGTLLAAAIIYAFRLSFSLWSRERRWLAAAIGIPAALYGGGLLVASFGFGVF